MNRLPTTFFAGRRKALLGAVEADLVVVTANGRLQRSADTTFPFRQDSNFFYLTGLNEPDLIWVGEPATRRQWLILPPRSDYQQVFEGDVDREELKRLSGIAGIETHERGWERLELALKRAKRVAMIEPPTAYIEPYGFYTNPARAALRKRLEELKPRLKTLNLAPLLANLRVVKEPAELRQIQAAIDLTAEAFAKAKRSLKRYRNEHDIQLAIEHHLAQAGHGVAYETIVGAGEHACVLHYTANDAPLKGDLVLVDAGAASNYYAADITRTWPLKEPSKLASGLLKVVGELQDYAYELLKPGVELKYYEQSMHQAAGEKLVELGLVKRPTAKAIRRYFPHSTSHWLGLDVHDAGDYGRPLEAGMVLTVEPGLYVPEHNVGVRIEDNVLITKGGLKVLSSAIPRY